MILLEITPTDEEAFIESVEDIADGLGEALAPNEIYLVRVKNWFDHKWLNFSGKGRVRFDWGQMAPDTSLDEFHQDQIVFPPFTPNRLLSQTGYERTEDGSYARVPRRRFIHRPFLAHSSTNLHRRVLDFSRSACFLWFSSNSKINGFGSLLVFEATDDIVKPWYASFRRDEKWRVMKTKGIASERLDMLFPCQLV